MKSNASKKNEWINVFRGPALWTFSICSLFSAYLIWARAAVDPVLPISCLAAAIVFFFGVTAFSISLFWHDFWIFILQPVILKPAIEAASKYSLDDLLRFLCDPGQLLATLSGAIMFPITLYTLPTTTQQRAEALQTSGLIPNDRRDDAVSILTAPGGWKELLSTPVRRFLRQAVNDEDQNNTDSDGDVSDENSVSTAPDDRTTNHCQYSISPVYRTTVTSESPPPPPSSLPPPQEKTVAQTRRKVEPVVVESLPRRRLQRQYQEPYEVLGSIVADLVQAKASSFCQSLHDQQATLAPTAVAAAALLAIQLLHSRTARSNVRSLLHLVVTAGAGTALTGSLLALLAPYYFTQHHSMTSRRGQGSSRTAASGNHQCVNYQNGVKWPVVVSSMLAAVTAVLVPQSPLLRRQTVMKALLKWKGTIAALVLLCFQWRRRRHRQQLERAEHESVV